MNTILSESKAATPTRVGAAAPAGSSVQQAPAAGQSVAAHKIKTILVPIDFSQGSMQALSYAMSLGRKFNSVIHLISVQEPDGASEVQGAGHLMRECADAARFITERLPGAQREQISAFSPENSHVRTGRAYEEICKMAKEIGTDLIVIATRGHSGLKHVLLGSTTDRVVRFSPCPVLVVRQRKRKGRAPVGGVSSTSTLPIRKILVPVDFSTCALAGVLYAASLAREFGADLRLFHVIHPAYPDVLDRVSANPAGGSGQVARTNAELDIEALTKLEGLREVKCETEVRSGNVAEEICGAASQPDVDLMVTSTHGRTGFRHILIGSVAEQVVRYSNCPVLIVPSRLADSIDAL
jgi:nucleotide-binding universal stress UspA family protein